MKQKLVPFIDDDGKNHWPIHIDQVSGFLHYVKKHRGRKVQFSTRCTKDQLVRAKRIINEELAKRLGTKRVVKTQPLIKDELPLWVAVKEAEETSDVHKVHVRYAAKNFIEPFWGNRFPLDMMSSEIRAEWYAWFAVEFPGQQMEGPIKFIRNFCTYLTQKLVNETPLLPGRPQFTDPNRKEVRRTRKRKTALIFTAEDFKKIHAAALNSDEALVIHIMYCMATRIEETLSMSFGAEIDLDSDVPIYRWSDGQNKADLDGFHALHPSLIEPLRALRKRRAAEGTDRLFPQKWNNQAHLKAQQIDWKKWRERANIGWHWTSKTFRHTCLSNLFNDERNPQVLILKLYRVSLQVALETYVKPNKSGIEKMRSALEVSL